MKKSSGNKERLLSATAKRVKWPTRPGVNPAAKFYSNWGQRCRSGQYKDDGQYKNNPFSAYDCKLNIGKSSRRPHTQPSLQPTLPFRDSAAAEPIRINTALPSRRQRLWTRQGCRSGIGTTYYDN